MIAPPRTPRVFALLLGTLLAGACSAKVHHVVASPSHVCAGTPIVLDVKVTGRKTLTIDPALEPDGRSIYRPQTSTRFMVTAKSCLPPGTDGGEAGVTVLSPDEPDEITANVVCQGGELIGTVPRPPAEWDPRLRVRTIESGESRAISIRHAGREARLTPQMPTTRAFEGTSPGGDWILSSPLVGSERCGGNPPPPDILNVQVQVACEERR